MARHEIWNFSKIFFFGGGAGQNVQKIVILTLFWCTTKLFEVLFGQNSVRAWVSSWAMRLKPKKPKFVLLTSPNWPKTAILRNFAWIHHYITAISLVCRMWSEFAGWPLKDNIQHYLHTKIHVCQPNGLVVNWWRRKFSEKIQKSTKSFLGGVFLKIFQIFFAWSI